MNFYHKKGQITIFILIAVIVVAGVGIFFAFKNTSLKNLFVSDADSVNIFVEKCIEDIGAEAVYEIGRNGGYISSPEPSTKLGTPYYIKNNQTYLPAKERIQEEISDYVNEKLDFCINDFENFPNLVITSGEVNTETTIEDERVILNVKYPLTITKGEDTSIIDAFDNLEIPVRLGIVYNAAEEIVEEQINEPNICLTCINGIIIEKDLFVQLVDNDEGDIFFVITDKNSKMNNNFFDYIFAINVRDEENVEE